MELMFRPFSVRRGSRKDGCVGRERLGLVMFDYRSFEEEGSRQCAVLARRLKLFGGRNRCS